MTKAFSLVTIFLILFVSCSFNDGCDNNTLDKVNYFNNLTNIEQDIKSARIYFDENLKGSSKCYLIHVCEAGLLQHEGNYDKALNKINIAIEKQQNEKFLFTLRGYIYINKENYDQAIKDCKVGLKHNPQSSSALTCLGKAEFEKHNFKQAINYFEKSLNINPKEIKIRSYLAFAYLDYDKTKSLHHLNYFLSNYKNDDRERQQCLKLYKLITGNDYSQ